MRRQHLTSAAQAVTVARHWFTDWLRRQQRLRRRRLQVTLLEDRRLPDASFALAAGVLTLDGFDAADSLQVSFDSSSGEFQFSLQHGQWDAADLGGGPFGLTPDQQTLSVLLPTLTELQIDAGAAALTAVTQGTGSLSVGTLQISGGGQVSLNAAGNDFDEVHIQADALQLTDSDDLTLTHLQLSGNLQLHAGDSLSSTPGASIEVTGHAQLSAASIALGTDATETVRLGSLTFFAAGSVHLTSADDVQLTGANSANSLRLQATGSITDTDGTELLVAGRAELVATEIHLGEHTADTLHTGSLLFHADTVVDIHEDSSVALLAGSTAHRVSLTAAGQITAEQSATGTLIEATDIWLSAAGDLGTADTALQLDADQLTTDTQSAAGDQYLAAVDQLTIADIDAGDGRLYLTSGDFISSGSITAGHVYVQSGAVLQGTGSIAAAVEILSGGRLEPGLSPGLLQTGDLQLSPGSELQVEIHGLTPGSEFDQVSVTGTVTLGGTLHVDLLAGLQPAAGTEFCLIANDGTDAVVGSFQGLSEGSVLDLAGQQFVLSYQGGDGNDVVLSAGLPVYQFAQTDWTLTEGNSGLTTQSTVQLLRSGNTSVAATVDVLVSSIPGNTAVANADFISETVTVQFAIGATTAAIPLQIHGDAVVEYDETLQLSLQNFSHGGSSGSHPTTATVTLSNDDVAGITVADFEAVESGTFVFELSMDRSSDHDITVVVHTADIVGQATAGLDYLPVAGQVVTFTANGAAGQRQFVTVTVADDDVVEASQQFNLLLSDVRFDGVADSSRARVDDNLGTATILNNDIAILSMTSAAVLEGDTLHPQLVFEVELSADVEGGFAAHYRTVDGTATSAAGPYQDFVSQSGTLSFSGLAQERRTVTVAAIADTWSEDTESFGLTIDSITPVDPGLDPGTTIQLAGDPASGTLINDDTQVLVRVVGGNLLITDEVPGGSSDSITLAFDQTTQEYVISSAGGGLGSGPGQSFNELRVAAAQVTGQLIVDLRGGNDVLTVDFRQGSPLAAGGLVYAGGTQTTADGLVVIGNGLNHAVYNPSAVTFGDGIITVDGRQIVFTGLEPVDLSGMAEVVISLPGAADELLVSAGTDYLSGGTQDALRVSGTSAGVAIESVALWDNAVVRIDTTASDGNDLITISGAANLHDNGDLLISTGSGADQILVTGPVLLGGRLELQSAEILLDTDSISTGATQEYLGSTRIGQAVHLTASSVIFQGTVDSATGEQYLLQVTGSALFADDVGTSQRLLGVAIEGAQVEFLGPVSLSSAGLQVLTTDSVTLHGKVTTISGGDVQITNGGLLTLHAAADLLLDGKFVQDGPGAVQSAADIITTGDTITLASTITQSGDLTLDSTAGGLWSGNDLQLADVTSAGFNLTLNAGTQGHISAGQIADTATLRIQNSSSTTISGPVSVTVLQIDDTIGTVTLQGDLTADIVAVRSSGDIDLSASNPLVRQMSLQASQGTIHLPALLAVTGDLWLEAQDVSAAGPITLAAQRTLFRSGQSEVIYLEALSRDSGGQPGDAGTDAGQLDAATLGTLELHSTAAQLEIADLDLNGYGLATGNQPLSIDSAGTVTQQARIGSAPNSRIVASQLQLTGSGTYLLDNPTNDVDVLAAAVDGGLTYRDVDDLTIGTAQTVAGIQARTDVRITAAGDLSVVSSVITGDGLEDTTAATGETILLESIDGNLQIGSALAPVVISTDENFSRSNAETGDRIVLIADSDATASGDLDGDLLPDTVDPDLDGDGLENAVDPTVDGLTEGRVTITGDVTVRSDGGVARQFGPRPAAGATDTAFFEFETSPLPVAVDNAPTRWQNQNAYISAWSATIGVTGEENLVVQTDWLDPVNEAGVAGDPTIAADAAQLGVTNPVTSERQQTFLVAEGGQVNTVGHVYTTRDYTLFQTAQNRTTIPVVFSVSHHPSLSVQGTFIEQSAPGQPVADRNLSSTDNSLTPPPAWENGYAEFRIPTVTPAPPGLFASAAAPRTDRPTVVAPPELRAALDPPLAADFGGGAAGGSVFSTIVYFQIRRRFETDAAPEVVIERITDGRLIASRPAFEKFVQEHPELQDGSEYEIWLVTETGGQRVERPIVEFEITGGRPGPAQQDTPDHGTAPRLRDVPFEAPNGEQPPSIPPAPEPPAPEPPPAGPDQRQSQSTTPQRLDTLEELPPQDHAMLQDVPLAAAAQQLAECDAIPPEPSHVSSEQPGSDPAHGEQVTGSSFAGLGSVGASGSLLLAASVRRFRRTAARTTTSLRNPAIRGCQPVVGTHPEREATP